MTRRSAAGTLGLAAAAWVLLIAPPAASGPPLAAAGAGPGEIVDGAQLFATMCGWCHQSGGRAVGRGPKLAGTRQSDTSIINRIKTGKPGAMPAYGGVFTDEQIRAIVTYIRGLEHDGR